MTINNYNEFIINSKQLCVHDDYLLFLSFDSSKNMLCLTLKKYELNYDYEITFNNVLAYEMTSCRFWDNRLEIFDFECLQQHECVLLPKLFLHPDAKRISKKIDDYLEVRFTFSSGDTLNIACELISVNNNTGDGSMC